MSSVEGRRGQKLVRKIEQPWWRRGKLSQPPDSTPANNIKAIAIIPYTKVLSKVKPNLESDRSLSQRRILSFQSACADVETKRIQQTKNSRRRLGTVIRDTPHPQRDGWRVSPSNDMRCLSVGHSVAPIVWPPTSIASCRTFCPLPFRALTSANVLVLEGEKGMLSTCQDHIQGAARRCLASEPSSVGPAPAIGWQRGSEMLVPSRGAACWPLMLSVCFVMAWTTAGAPWSMRTMRHPKSEHQMMHADTKHCQVRSSRATPSSDSQGWPRRLWSSESSDAPG